VPGGAVAGQFGDPVRRGLAGQPDPAAVPAAAHLHAHHRPEGVPVDAVVPVPHHGAVDVLGDDEDQRIARGLQRLFDPGRVEQAEGDVERFPEAPVGVVGDLPRVHDDADSQHPLGPADAREAGVAVGQQLAQGGDGLVQQDRLGGPVHRADEGQHAVAPVDEPVAVAPLDAGRAQRRVEQLVHRAAELGLDGIRTAGRLLDVERDDGPVMRQACCH
jgi:hypothetical protein